MKVKVLESFGFGVPVVTMSEGSADWLALNGSTPRCTTTTMG